MPVFDHDEIQIFYRDRGTGQPFIFQHGLGADSSQPFELFKPGPGIRQIGFDARAHGQTRPAGDPRHFGFATFAADLRALMDHLGIERAVVGGISMGAGIALRFTLSHPERVQALVLSRPAWLDAPSPWNARMFTLITTLLREHGPALGKERFMASRDYTETLAQWPDVAASLAGQFDSPQVAETAEKYQRIITDCPNRDPREWETLGVPTLILANRRDPIHPFEIAQTLAAAIPGATLRELTPKAVNVPQHNADTHHAITKFLEGHFPIR